MKVNYGDNKKSLKTHNIGFNVRCGMQGESGIAPGIEAGITPKGYVSPSAPTTAFLSK